MSSSNYQNQYLIVNASRWALRPQYLVLLAAIRSFGETCFASYNSISDRSGLSKSQILRGIVFLKENNHISIQQQNRYKGKYSTNIIRINDTSGDKIPLKFLLNNESLIFRKIKAFFFKNPHCGLLKSKSRLRINYASLQRYFLSVVSKNSQTAAPVIPIPHAGLQSLSTLIPEQYNITDNTKNNDREQGVCYILSDVQNMISEELKSNNAFRNYYGEIRGLIHGNYSDFDIKIAAYKAFLCYKISGNTKGTGWIVSCIKNNWYFNRFEEWIKEKRDNKVALSKLQEKQKQNLKDTAEDLLIEGFWQNLSTDIRNGFLNKIKETSKFIMNGRILLESAKYLAWQSRGGAN